MRYPLVSTELGADTRKKSLELLPVLTIVDSVTRRRDPFSCGDRGRTADDGDEATMTPYLYTQHAKAGLSLGT